MCVVCVCVHSQILDSITSGRALHDPSLLSRFLLLVYADLKAQKFVHWFAFPALAPPSAFSWGPDPSAAPLSTALSASQLRTFHSSLLHLCHGGGGDDSTRAPPPFFVVHRVDDDTVAALPLSRLLDVPHTHCWLGFVDTSSSDAHPGWPLRYGDRQHSLSAVQHCLFSLTHSHTFSFVSLPPAPLSPSRSLISLHPFVLFSFDICARPLPQ